MKKGRLNQSEKYIIQGMISDKKSVNDISNEVKRSEKCIQNYIDNELDQVIEHVVQAKIGHVQEQEKHESGRFEKGMIKETSGGKDGVSIMTQVASEISDAQSTANKQHRSKIKDAIFNIRENRMENE